MDDVLLTRLQAAHRRSGLRLDDICDRLRKSGGSFHPDPPALSRKLRNKTSMTFTECQELAAVFGFDLRWSLRRRRSAA